MIYVFQFQIYNGCPKTHEVLVMPYWKQINLICHNGFPPRLGRPQKYEVATDLFCTGVIGHPGHVFLN